MSQAVKVPYNTMAMGLAAGFTEKQVIARFVKAQKARAALIAKLKAQNV